MLFLRQATAIVTCVTLIGVHDVYSQTKINYNFFSKPSLGGIQVNIPQPSSFQQVNIVSGNLPNTTPVLPNNPLTQMNSSIEENNRRMLAQNGMLPGFTGADLVKQRADVERDMMQEKFYQEYLAWYKKTEVYRNTLSTIESFNPDSFSLTKAVFLVENAYQDNKYSYQDFLNGVVSRAELVKQILKREGLSPKNNLALNYGIQKLYQRYNQFYDKATKRTYDVKPFRYDFDDIRGEKDYTKMFTSKMMMAGKGQCHSMPLLYLMIAEQLGAKAWLSLAPQHSFIQFKDANGNLVNFETTNGNLVSNNWLLQSGFINANALREKTYLDTLSQRKLYAQCLSDLLLGYINKFGYDELSDHIRRKILQVDSTNMTALIVDANLKTHISMQKITAAGKPKEGDLPKFPDAYKAYLDMVAAYEKVDGRGYQDMPKEAYQAWLKTIDKEKKKQQTKELQEEMQREIQRVKKLKFVVIDKTKN